MKKLEFVLVSTLLLVISCDWPFNAKESDENIFELNISHDIIRVMPTAQILLSWSEITVESFASFRIERKTVSDTLWTTVAELSNSLLTSYLDTINDDENLLYRVGIVDTEDKIVWAEGSTSIPRTTTVIIPDEFTTIQPAINSALLDDGDEIKVKPGHYAETLYIAGKDILIKSFDGYEYTFLTRTELPDSVDAQRVVNISSGTLDGFTIENGEPMHGSGGGIVIAGNAMVKNCYISDNYAKAYKNGGYGGGVYILDNGKLYNSIIVNNTCFKEGCPKGIFAHSAHGEIINNTIVSNDVLISGNCTGLVFINNIIYNTDPDIHFADDSSKSGVIIDYSILVQNNGLGQNNIYADPQFIDNIGFLTQLTSPAIDAGHPDEEYNDIDGTRNDIGAYGGPHNKK